MLAALLKTSERPKPRPAPMRSREAAHGILLFEALTCEVHWTTLQIGAVAACMNASLGLRRAWMLRASTNLMPVESPVVKTALRAWQDIALPRELAAMIARLYFNLADAKVLALPLITNAGIFSAPHAPLAKLEQINAIWRQLLEDSRDVLLELEPETRWRLDAAYTDNALVLGKFLKEIISGSHACVNQYGEAVMPLLPQRRTVPRFTLREPCKLFSEGTVSVAVARDISKNGLSVDCDHMFRLKEPVVVILRNGRRLPGLVVWCKDGKTDILFESALSLSDPLISK